MPKITFHAIDLGSFQDLRPVNVFWGKRVLFCLQKYIFCPFCSQIEKKIELFYRPDLVALINPLSEFVPGLRSQARVIKRSYLNIFKEITINIIQN